MQFTQYGPPLLPEGNRAIAQNEAEQGFIEISDDEEDVIVAPGRLPNELANPASSRALRSPLFGIDQDDLVGVDIGIDDFGNPADAQGVHGHSVTMARTKRPASRPVMLDYMNDKEIGRALSSNYRPGTPRSPPQPTINQPLDDPKDACISQVVVVFPDICIDHVSGLYDAVSQSPNQLIAHILDQPSPYPRAREVQEKLKRKVINEDEEAARKYNTADRSPGHFDKSFARQLLQSEFARTPATFIDETLATNQYRIFTAYAVLEEAERTFDHQPQAYLRLKSTRKSFMDFKEQTLDDYIDFHKFNLEEPWKHALAVEFKAARKVRFKADAKRHAEREAELAEEQNTARAEADGTMQECGCCFVHYPLNRMVHCNKEEDLHWFCRTCARMNAETEIGNSKYELICMSTDGCEGGFSHDQRNQFLDEKTKIGLERNEQVACLNAAGLENLASCPFCPYAAEYPPIEDYREFRCERPDCKKVSCRLCNQESHIPKSCEEHAQDKAKEEGLSVRRLIEEAMSEAMIRKCNKCQTPFVKEIGCNKMMCTRPGCGNLQCYVCSTSCGYEHFNDLTRGGKVGNCPLFDDVNGVEGRHEDEVKRAEKLALEKIMADHPDLNEEDLRIEMSEGVKKDDEERKHARPGAAAVLGFHPREGYAAYRAEMIRAFGPPRAHRGAADVGNAFPGAGDAYGGGDDVGPARLFEGDFPGRADALAAGPPAAPVAREPRAALPIAGHFRQALRLGRREVLNLPEVGGIHPPAPFHAPQLVVPPVANQQRQEQLAGALERNANADAQPKRCNGRIGAPHKRRAALAPEFADRVGPPYRIKRRAELAEGLDAAVAAPAAIPLHAIPAHLAEMDLLVAEMESDNRIIVDRLQRNRELDRMAADARQAEAAQASVRPIVVANAFEGRRDEKHHIQNVQAPYARMVHNWADIGRTEALLAQNQRPIREMVGVADPPGAILALGFPKDPAIRNPRRASKYPAMPQPLVAPAADSFELDMFPPNGLLAAEGRGRVADEVAADAHDIHLPAHMLPAVVPQVARRDRRKADIGRIQSQDIHLSERVIERLRRARDMPMVDRERLARERYAPEAVLERRYRGINREVLADFDRGYARREREIQERQERREVEEMYFRPRIEGQLLEPGSARAKAVPDDDAAVKTDRSP